MDENDEDLTRLVPALTQLMKLQRAEGLRLLSFLFSWSEYTEERCDFHQEFVYDITTFAASRGLSWPDVARTAITAKSIFPKLDGVDAAKLLSLLRDALCDCLPNLSPLQRHEFTRFLTETCVSRHRLFQAVVSGAGNINIEKLQLELQLPPTPLPLAQGTEQHEWECQLQIAQVSSKLHIKEEKLRNLREGLRVTVQVEEHSEDDQLDQENIMELVREAVKASEEQMMKSLDQETSLLSEIVQLRLQLEDLQSEMLQSNHDTATKRPDKSSKTKAKETPKTRRR